MPYIPGYLGGLVINGTPYAFAGINLSSHTDLHPTPNTEGKSSLTGVVEDPAAKTSIPGQYQMDITVQEASFDSTQALFFAPLSLSDGDVCAMEIYPDKNGANAYLCPCVLIESIDHSINADALQPFSFRARTVGAYTLP